MRRKGEETGTGAKSREDYAEQRELKSLSFHGAAFFS